MRKSIVKLYGVLKVLTKFRLLKVHKDSIIISTLPKSGTTYLRLILTNYFYNFLSKKDDYEKIEYDLMEYELFPNSRNDILIGKTKYQKPKLTLDFGNNIIYKDLIYDHGNPLDRLVVHIPLLFPPPKTIFLYRNPYDTLVSRYYYYYKNRVGKENKITHPRELISAYIPTYSNIYNRMKSITASSDSAILMSYEELKSDTEKAMTRILNHLEIPIDIKMLRFSIEASSSKNVKLTENRIGGAIQAPDFVLRGSFVRSGAIGQWMDYFSEAEIKNINDILESNSISIDEFIIS